MFYTCYCFFFNILKSSFILLKVASNFSHLVAIMYFGFVIISLFEMLSFEILFHYLLTNLSIRLLPSHPPQPLYPSVCDSFLRFNS